MTPVLLTVPEVRHIWGRRFEAVSRAALVGSAWPDLRVCSGVWYVAGILYQRDLISPIPDEAFDALSRHLLDHLDEARAAGANMLEADDLRAGTAMNWRKFPQAYQTVADDMRGSRL